ncbi:MAG: signal peptidase II [Thermoanaerobacteraceae bacterium]|uniref:signal peptidase II n=1 Tax=Thermanaeromonas sp. C210 TaxID=2731925 RepID=UPI00155CD595|nr:signal peptidase II [Thermanaeromonas sp. C210]MBE3581028.1 signal peptidase II [Thermoanaerobacteraceae bacterium]GFN24050.1 lipoprotein signal peptidase [Thermanaeromonas sp. C210]
MLFPLLVLAIVAGDQLTKMVVRRTLAPNETVPVLDNIFHLTHVNNPGAAFGLLAHRTSFFIATGIIVTGLIIIAYRQFRNGGFYFQLALALQLGGALGNLLDRLRFGYVVDFLDFRIWPVFNLADVAIVGGASLLVWQLWRRGGEGERERE